MPAPYLEIDLGLLRANAASVAEFCGRRGIEVWGVTKGACGLPEVARAMLEGGVAGLGESRLPNMARLSRAGIRAPSLLLRLPQPSEAEAVVAAFDLSLNSELETMRALGAAATRAGLRHGVLLMVDLGDLREGVWPDQALGAALAARDIEGLELAGIGANLSCYGGVIPSAENLGLLASLARELEAALGRRLRYVSGGNTSSLPLVASGGMPREVNMLRIGEAILLGTESVRRTPWPGTSQEVFTLRAEVIECRRKPSLPLGEIGQDGFGGHPIFEDRGLRLRAILALGRQDVAPEGLLPLEPGVEVLGASSDHLILDVTGRSKAPRVGELLSFRLGYGALLRAMTSPYVEKRFV